MNRKSFISMCFLLILAPSSTGSAQTREQVRSALESSVRKMTAEEITQKLQEMGMTLEDAARKARELNITLEEYVQLAMLSASRQQETFAPFLPAIPQVTARMRDSLLLERRDSLLAFGMRKRFVRVPGFTGRTGIDTTLQPFGFEVFDLSATLFAPPMTMATSSTYVLGPSDEITITIWGETKLSLQTVVNREGNVVVPDAGPIGAAGLTVQDFRQRLLRRLTAVYSGLRNGGSDANAFLDVSIGKLRTVQVFVLGDVRIPGGYAVSSMSTAFHALYLAGGPTENGTMREIQVLRAGATLPAVDLYDFLLRGSKTSDLRLQDGDVVFVKPAIKRVAVQGRVIRPGIYEAKANETLGEMIKLAGGVRFDAYVNRVHLERVIPFDQRNQYENNQLAVDLDFRKHADLLASSYKLEDGDALTIREVSGFPENRVFIMGNVKKPGPYQLKEGMGLRDLILVADSLERSTFAERGTLFRTLPNLRREVHAFNPRLALQGDGLNNLTLQNEDSVIIYRESEFFPRRMVSIAGAVRKPGTYFRDEQMTVADLVVLAGGLTEYATVQGWEVSRAETTTVGVYSRVFRINMPQEYWEGGEGAKFFLKDLDHVLVPTDPRKSPPKVVSITGYVMFPGDYSIRREGERLSSIITRAGGLREGSYLEGSRLFRRLHEAGLVPLDFTRALEDTMSRDNIEVLDRDSIYVARQEDLIYVRGEVFVPSSVLYKRGGSVKYYIQQAGGFKEEADEGRVVVFLPSGRKWESGGLFGAPEILAGSAIYVPKKIEKEDKTLPVLRDLATILASLAAITIAIVQVTK